MSKLAQLQDAAGLSEVIWVDDIFAGEPEVQLLAHVRACIRKLHNAGIPLKHNALKNIPPTAPENVRDKLIDSALDQCAGKLPGVLDSLMRQEAESLPSPEHEENVDLNLGQVNSLIHSLINVRRFSLTTWNNDSAVNLAKATDGSLFLIDREFVNEGFGSNAGDDILTEVVTGAPNSHCIMLTHTVSPSDADALRLTIANKKEIPAHRFAVMSKRDLGQLSHDVDPYFARALKTVMVHRFCSDVADAAVKVMTDASQITVSDLATLSVEEVDRAIFENSITEGASEIDVVTRILMLRQRMAVQDKMASESGQFYERLAHIRAVRDIDLGDSELTSTAKKKGLLHEWRTGEVFDAGEYLNPINSPLSCGDVFLDTTDKQRYVLLAQSCDITVRGRGGNNGKRNREDGILVKLNVGEPRDRIRMSSFEIKRMELGDQSWTLDFTSAVIINLRVLDWAVFNSNGKVEWTEGQPIPIALLPGWRKRFDNMITQMSAADLPLSVRQLCFEGSMPLAECEFADGVHRFPLNRIGRIRSPYAEAIHASYAAFISRAAFDHNFAEGLCATVEKSDIQASDDSQSVDPTA